MGREDDMELIPGTEVVYRGSKNELDSTKELMLVPRPTNNPDDPLVSRFFFFAMAALDSVVIN